MYVWGYVCLHLLKNRLRRPSQGKTVKIKAF